MPNPIHVILLYGGKSGEHEISLISAASVLNHLNSERYRITPIGIDKSGCFYINDYPEMLAHKKALPVLTATSRALDSLFVRGKLAVEADVVFPMVHGPLYEDGCLQGLLELIGVAYVGSNVLASAIGMDKDMARRIACVNGIKSARYHLLTSHDFASGEMSALCERIGHQLGWPLMVKPCSMGSSVGIHKVNHLAELVNAVNDARRYDHSVLIEEFIKGREIEVAVLENSSPALPPKVSLPGEIRVSHADGFYSYTAKYLESDQTELIAPARLSDSLTTKVQQAAADIFLQLKCSGMARVDFFVDDQTEDIYFSEINTIPGFTPISMYPKMWEVSGLPYSSLLDRLIELSLIHQKNRERLVTHYQ